MLTLPNLSTGSPLRYDDGTTYADDDVRLEHSTTYEWPHALSEVVQALLDAGLRITSLGEHRTIRCPSGYVLPAEPLRLPLTFSLTATKPAASQPNARDAT